MMCILENWILVGVVQNFDEVSAFKLQFCWIESYMVPDSQTCQGVKHLLPIPSLLEAEMASVRCKLLSLLSMFGTFICSFCTIDHVTCFIQWEAPSSQVFPKEVVGLVPIILTSIIFFSAILAEL